MASTASEIATRIAHQREVARGERFEFGKNWQQFLGVLDENRIRRAEDSLLSMLREPTLAGRTFLDIGSGSGLFSLAACRLGARVHSFDFDQHSVACAEELRRRYFPGTTDWVIEHGSVLDPGYMHALGSYDIVYSWGVLHHTSRMWDAIDLASQRVRPGGKFFIAIYNDLGSRTRRWRTIKKLYNRLPRPLRPALTVAAIAPEEIKAMIRAAVTLRPGDYIRGWTGINDRGMNRWRDAVDWVGGYPYEAATPEAIFDFARERGFTLTGLKCGGVGLGCNEFVFDRSGAK
jgi:2-polyprenyl-3-methyl-5-hydroxy-6-metoxy-1,4-benzoquinol methylase